MRPRLATAGFVKDMEAVAVIMHGGGALAAAAEGGEDGALEENGAGGGGAEERCEERGVFSAALEGDGALAGRGNHFLDGKRLEDKPVESSEAEAGEAGGGEEGGVGVAGGDFLQARVNVAAQLEPVHMASPGRESENGLGAATRAAGGDGARGGNVGTADEDIAGVGPREKAGEDETIGECGGQVLGTVDGKAGAASEDGVLKLAREEPFAPLFGEGPVALAVAGGGEFEQLDATPRGGRHGREGGAGELGLAQREGTAAGGEDKRGWAGSGHGTGARV